MEFLLALCESTPCFEYTAELNMDITPTQVENN